MNEPTSFGRKWQCRLTLPTKIQDQIESAVLLYPANTLPYPDTKMAENSRVTLGSSLPYPDILCRRPCQRPCHDPAKIAGSWPGSTHALAADPAATLPRPCQNLCSDPAVHCSDPARNLLDPRAPPSGALALSASKWHWLQGHAPGYSLLYIA